MKKRIWSLASFLCLSLFTASVAFAAEAPSSDIPQNLRIPALSADEHSITLIWEKPVKYENISGYHIYMNGKMLGDAEQNQESEASRQMKDFYQKNPKAQPIQKHMYMVKDLLPATEYAFSVRAVDASGKESADSNIVRQATIAVQKIYNVQDFGAVGDGETVNTKAIQAAINACTPGDKVLIPAGVFKSGALWLKSNMTLEIAKNGVLLGSENAADYPYHFKLYPYSSDERYYGLINAIPEGKESSLEKIRIVGEGTIDGNGWAKNEEGTAYLYAHNTNNADGSLDAHHVLNIGIAAKAQVESLMASGQTLKSAYPRRANLVTMRNVKQVYYGGLHVVNPANHTLVNIRCDDVTVNDVDFYTYDCNNGDGIEFTHGNGLIVINSVFDTGDDCVNFAAGLGELGKKDPSTKNIWIFNNSFHHGHGAVVTGSHTAAWIENILAEDNIIENTDIGFRAKTAPQIGGGARHIVFRDNALKNIRLQPFIFTSGYSDPNAVVEYPKSKTPGKFMDIKIQNCTIDKAGGAAIEIQGLADACHEALVFENLRFHQVKPMKINYLKNGSFENIVFEEDKKQAEK